MLSHQLITLAIIQGLTEFIPVSSSGHLVIISRVLGWPDQGLFIDVALHFGTLLAVMVYFWRDLWLMLVGLMNQLRGQHNYHGKLAIYLIIATIPAVVTGITINKYMGPHLRNLSFIGMTTIIFGIILYLIDSRCRSTKNLSNMNYTKAMLMGCAQALALVPGVSRSGICLTMARWLGINRVDAARFTFLMSIPVIIGACVHTSLKLQLDQQSFINEQIITAVIMAFLIGLVTINFMLKWLVNHSLKPFMIYRVVLGTGLLLCANL